MFLLPNSFQMTFDNVRRWFGIRINAKGHSRCAVEAEFSPRIQKIGTLLYAMKNLFIRVMSPNTIAHED